MAEFIESDLKFTFDDDLWNHVIKFDEKESSIYKQMKDNLQGSKAVDFVGIKDEKTLYSRSQTLFGNAFHDAPRRVPGRGASMNGFPNRVWEPEKG